VIPLVIEFGSHDSKQLVAAELSPSVRSVVSVTAAPLTEATTKSEPFGSTAQVRPGASSRYTVVPLPIEIELARFASASVIVSDPAAPE